MLSLHPILLVQRAPVIQRLCGCGSERPVDGVFSLHRHGPRSYRSQRDAAGLQDGSSGRDRGEGGAGPGLSWRLLPELSVFTATLPGKTSVGLNCSHSPLLRLREAGASAWERSLPEPSVFAAALLGASCAELPCSDTPSPWRPAARATDWRWS